MAISSPSGMLNGQAQIHGILLVICMPYKLILLGGDETLWTFDAQEYMWASLLKLPLRKRTQDSIIDQDANILILSEGTRKFLDWCREQNLLVATDPAKCSAILSLAVALVATIINPRLYFLLSKLSNGIEIVLLSPVDSNSSLTFCLPDFMAAEVRTTIVSRPFTVRW